MSSNSPQDSGSLPLKQFEPKEKTKINGRTGGVLNPRAFAVALEYFGGLF
jgi:hypothetical protein